MTVAHPHVATAIDVDAIDLGVALHAPDDIWSNPQVASLTYSERQRVDP
jgi:hypothetical protein